jgi:cytochrome c oxidase cbb3-type subunit 3
MRALAAAVLALVAVACGGSEEPAPGSKVPVPAPAPPVPEPEAELAPVPAGSLRGDAAAGKVLYGQFCAVCHGASGKGDGPTAATLFPKPRDHTDAAYMGSVDDAYLYRVVDGGGASVGKSPLMPPWGGALNEQDLKDVIAYVRTLSGT